MDSETHRGDVIWHGPQKTEFMMFFLQKNHLKYWSCEGKIGYGDIRHRKRQEIAFEIAELDNFFELVAKLRQQPMAVITCVSHG